MDNKTGGEKQTETFPPSSGDAAAVTSVMFFPLHGHRAADTRSTPRKRHKRGGDENNDRYSLEEMSLTCSGCNCWRALLLVLVPVVNRSHKATLPPAFPQRGAATFTSANSTFASYEEMSRFQLLGTGYNML